MIDERKKSDLYNLISCVNLIGSVDLGGGGGGGGGRVVRWCWVNFQCRGDNLEYSRARAYCACSRCGWGLVGHFHSHLSFLSSFSFSLGDGPI